MRSKTKNYIRLKNFFTNEYHSLRLFVNSRIREVADRDADDIIQDVALKIFSRIDNLSLIHNISGFVYSSIRYKIIDIMRKENQEIYIDDILNKRWVEFAHLVYEETNQFEVEDKIAKLKIAISKLKLIYQEIIIAIYFEDYTYRELSFETGIPIGTLLSRQHREIVLLYKQLKINK